MTKNEVYVVAHPSGMRETVGPKRLAELGDAVEVVETLAPDTEGAVPAAGVTESAPPTKGAAQDTRKVQKGAEKGPE